MERYHNLIVITWKLSNLVFQERLVLTQRNLTA